MTATDVVVRDEGEGAYTARVASHDGATVVTLVLGEAPALTGGALAADAATAAATIGFLLTHQDAADLPSPVEIGDVLAAYPDAVEQILARLP